MRIPLRGDCNQNTGYRIEVGEFVCIRVDPYPPVFERLVTKMGLRGGSLRIAPGSRAIQTLADRSGLVVPNPAEAEQYTRPFA